MAGVEGALHWFWTFVGSCRSGNNAEIRLYFEGGQLKVNMCAGLGPVGTQPEEVLRSYWRHGERGLKKASPSKRRRRERRAAERAEKFSLPKADVEVEVSELKAAEKVAAVKAAVEVATTKAAVEEATVKAADEVATKEPCVNPATMATEKMVSTLEVGVEEKATTSCYGSQPSCQNCNCAMTPSHQCDEETSNAPDSTVGEEQTSPPVCLPLCHYCCHWGSGEDPVHYFLQCICADWPCTCWCYCDEAQLEHKKLVFPAGFGLPGYKMKTVNSVDRPKARAVAESRIGKEKPCDNPSCMKDFKVDNIKAMQEL